MLYKRDELVMDISEKYIKMCELAKEIQKSWNPDIGDWFLSDYRGTTGFSRDVENQIWKDKKETWEKVQCLTYKSSIKDFVTISDSEGSHVYTMQDLFKRRHIWLPRKDQLQNILSNPEIMKFMREFTNEQFLTWTQEWSFEQLWIAFVMKEKFGKIWNGKDEWIQNNIQNTEKKEQL